MDPEQALLEILIAAHNVGALAVDNQKITRTAVLSHLNAISTNAAELRTWIENGGYLPSINDVTPIF